MEHVDQQTETGMEMRDLLSDPEFGHRAQAPRPYHYGFEAFRRLARVFAEKPEMILQELVNIACENCNADSAGISLEETAENGESRFRWVAISGSFAKFLHGTTPRFFSPCGTTLDLGRAQLYRVTKAYYDHLGIEAEPITDGMLIPWVTEELRGTIWAVSHGSREAFSPADFELLSGLADFSAIAIRYQTHLQELRKKDELAACLAFAGELAHRINNPLQTVTNALYLAQQGTPDAQVYAKQAAHELDQLTALVKQLLLSTKSGL